MVISYEVIYFQQIFVEFLCVKHYSWCWRYNSESKRSRAQMWAEQLCVQRSDSHVIGFQIFLVGCHRTLLLENTQNLW